jgi:calcineurin-like phosphoesterase family protein
MCYGVSAWDDKELNCRMFDTIDKMNDALVDSINERVGENDELYHIGDVSFGGINRLWEFRKRLKCKNIHLILGNHDHHIKKNHKLPNCHWSMMDDVIVDGENENIYGDDHVGNSYFDVYAEDLFKSVSVLKTIVIQKQKIVLCHFPIEQWEDMDNGSWHIHGHCHHKIDGCETNIKYKRIDVGWPSIYSFDDLKDIMKYRENKKH